MNQIYEQMIERLTVHYTSDAYSTDVSEGRKEFFEEAGIVDEENHSFEMRMSQFLEWYLFTRPLSSSDLPPVQDSLSNSRFEMQTEERTLYESLAKTRHSLFEFLKIRGEDIHIRDLFSGQKLIIHDSPVRIGFSREEIFDTRLIPHGESYMFAKAFCFHPAEATSYILNEVKKLRKSEPILQEALMLRLMKMRYKFEQYRHLKIEYVYTNERKLRF